jgi:NAD(P)H dehydrogenase (quinone)
MAVKVGELAPEEAIASIKDGPLIDLSHNMSSKQALTIWPGLMPLIFGTPTRYGLPTAQLKQFLDTTGPLWAKGSLVNKVCSAFTSAGTAHGVQETTIVNVNTTFYHWGAIIVGPGYADPIHFKAGNPYGASFTSNNGALKPDETALASARFQGKRVTELAAQFVDGRKKA